MPKVKKQESEKQESEVCFKCKGKLGLNPGSLCIWRVAIPICDKCIEFYPRKDHLSTIINWVTNQELHRVLVEKYNVTVYDILVKANIRFKEVDLLSKAEEALLSDDPVKSLYLLYLESVK